MNSFNLLIFLVVLAVSDANPSKGTLGAACRVTSYHEVIHATSNCATIIIDGITVPPGETLRLDLQDGATLIFHGTITFIPSNWTGPLVKITGKQVRVEGAPGSILDGLGDLYWDGKGDRGVIKPKFMKIKTSGSTFSNINLLNCPKQCVSINSNNTILTNWNIDVSDGDFGGGHNTDGFGISYSNYIIIQDSVIKNQDDCVVVNQGSNYLFKNLTCFGGHGLSLSVGLSPENGSLNTVSNVTFTDCKVVNSRNGIHVKTHADGGTGQISNVTYRNIAMSGITRYGINVQQDYVGGGGTGIANGNIPITDLTMSSIRGSMIGAKNSVAIFILCGTDGCSDWTWSDISFHNYNSSSCNFNPTGFTC